MSRKPKPSRADLEKFSVYYAALYQREATYPPGRPLPIHIAPFPFNYKTPTEVEVEV